MILRLRWVSASQYLIVYLEKLFDVCGLFNNFLTMWQLIIYRGTNCPVRQGGFFFLLDGEYCKVSFSVWIRCRVEAPPPPLTVATVSLTSVSAASRLPRLSGESCPCERPVNSPCHSTNTFWGWWLVVMSPEGSSCHKLCPRYRDSTAALQSTHIHVHKVPGLRVYYDDNSYCTPIHIFVYPFVDSHKC